MHFTAFIYAATAVLSATQTLAAATPNTEVDAKVNAVQPLIATDPVSACNCPNNCSHHEGSSCKYWVNTDSGSQVVTSKCGYQSGYQGLVCIH